MLNSSANWVVEGAFAMHYSLGMSFTSDSCVLPNPGIQETPVLAKSASFVSQEMESQAHSSGYTWLHYCVQNVVHNGRKV